MKTIKTYSYEILYFEPDPLTCLNAGLTNPTTTHLASDLKRAEENNPDHLKQRELDLMAVNEENRRRCRDRSA